jgi:DNA-binding FadR family transcriptional regulator
VLELLWHAADRYLHLLITGLDRDAETTEGRIDEHRHLLDLAIAGKTDELHAAWIAHLEGSENALAAALGNRD